MKKVELEGIVRKKLGTSPSNVLRRAGSVPAVVFGKGIKPINIEMNKKSFLKAVSGESGRNALITLKISDDGKHKSEVVLAQEIQRNPLDGEVLHVDFHKIVLTEKIKTKVRVDLVGLPMGVKDDGGILIHGLREIEVKYLQLQTFAVNLITENREKTAIITHIYRHFYNSTAFPKKPKRYRHCLTLVSQSKKTLLQSNWRTASNTTPIF